MKATNQMWVIPYINPYEGNQPSVGNSIYNCEKYCLVYTPNCYKSVTQSVMVMVVLKIFSSDLSQFWHSITYIHQLRQNSYTVRGSMHIYGTTGVNGILCCQE